jgi:hypothetical protein
LQPPLTPFVLPQNVMQSNAMDADDGHEDDGPDAKRRGGLVVIRQVGQH